MSDELERAWTLLRDYHDYMSLDDRCTTLSAIAGHVMLAVGALESIATPTPTPATEQPPVERPAAGSPVPGMDPNDKRQALRIALARAQMDLQRQLRQHRLDRGMSMQDVADRIAEAAVADVSYLERFGSNLTSADIRRYAGAVGAMVTYTVVPAEESPVSESGRGSQTRAAIRAEIERRIHHGLDQVADDAGLLGIGGGRASVIIADAIGELLPVRQVYGIGTVWYETAATPTATESES